MPITLDDITVLSPYPGIGGHMILQFNIVNNTDSVIPKNARIKFEGNSMFKALDQGIPDAVKPRGVLPTKQQMQIKLEGKSWARVEDVAECLCMTFILNIPGLNPIKNSIEPWMKYFAFPELECLATRADFINVAIIGVVGSGKSSWLQTIATMLTWDKEVKTDLLVVAGGSGHATVRINNFKVPGVENKIKIFDTPGVDSHNWPDLEFDMLLDGKLPKDWRLGDNVADLIGRVKDEDAVMKQLHAVILSVPFGTLDDEGQLANIQRLLKRLTRKEYNPFIMVSMVDLVDPAIRDNPLEPSSAILDTVKKASGVLGIPLNCFSLNVPYHKEDRRNFLLEVNALQILQRAVKAGAERQQRIARSLLGESDAEDAALAEAFAAKQKERRKSVKDLTSRKRKRPQDEQDERSSKKS